MHNNAIYIVLIPNSYSELESIQCPFVQMNSDSIVVSNLVTISANFPGFQFSDRVTLFHQIAIHFLQHFFQIQ